MTTPPDTGEAYTVVCPHCGETFESRLLGGASERNLGFKCPHCGLFVAFKPADEQERVEPTER